MALGSYKNFLRSLFDVAVKASSPDAHLASHLPSPPLGKTILIAVGKAAAAMARVTLNTRPDIQQGLVIIPYGYFDPGLVLPKGIDLVEARHPVPDEMALDAATKAFKLVQGLGKQDQLLALISGGGSSLMVSPLKGVSLPQKQKITEELLQSGAEIREINKIRSCLSTIKGGQLAKAAFPAQVITLVISDVPGDDPAYVASGPTVISPLNFQDIHEIARKYSIELPDMGLWLHEPMTDELNPGETTVIATGEHAIEAACNFARKKGIEHIINLGAALTGEAKTLAQQHAILALQQAKLPRNTLILSGGETSVTINHKNSGSGGRNSEYLLALAIALQGKKGIYALACDTDGIDGMGNNAGALITEDSLSRAEEVDLSPQDFLDRHDSYPFFKALDDLVITGPTRTNVNDFRAIFIRGSH